MRTCTLCRSERRREVEEALVSGTPLRHIAARYGTSTGALQRHRPHVGQALARVEAKREKAREGALAVVAESEAAKAAAPVFTAAALLSEMAGLTRRALACLDDAERDGDVRLRVVAIHQARENVSATAKLLSEVRLAGASKDAGKAERMARRMAAGLGVTYEELMETAESLEERYGDDAPPLAPPAPPPAPKPVEIPRPIPPAPKAPPVPVMEVAEPRIPEAEPVVPVPTLLDVARAGLERPRERAPEPEREPVYRPNYDIEFLP